MESENFYLSLWRNIRTSEPNLVLRSSLSLASALVLTAAGMAGAWAFARLGQGQWVRDEHIAAALFLAGICWCVTLVVLWQRMRNGGSFVMPAVATVAVAITVILGTVTIDEFMGRDEEYLMVAVVLLGGAVAILIWLPSVHRVLRGRPVVGEDNLVLVNCPRCGYSLIGLRALRCPECGEEFTIDELIRAQNYSHIRDTSSADQGANLLRLRDAQDKTQHRPSAGPPPATRTPRGQDG